MDKVTDVDNSGMVSDSAYVSVSSGGEVLQKDAAETNVKGENSSVPAAEQMRSRVNETGLEARNAVISEVVDKIVDQKLDQKLDEVLRRMQLISAKAEEAKNGVDELKESRSDIYRKIEACNRTAVSALYKMM